LSSECRFKASSILIVSVDIVIPSFVSTSWSFQFMASHLLSPLDTSLSIKNVLVYFCHTNCTGLV
jgi:hypothetical protein